MNFFILIVTLILLLALWSVLKRWPLTHHQRLLSYPTPPSWIQDLKNFFPAYHKMSAKAQGRLLDQLKLHMAEVPCLAVADCQVTTQIRLLALAPYCALTLVKTQELNRLKRILILLPEECEQFHPKLDSHDLLWVWHEQEKSVKNHPKLSSSLLHNRYAELLALGHKKSPSLEELFFSSARFLEIEQTLGWH